MSQLAAPLNKFLAFEYQHIHPFWRLSATHQNSVLRWSVSNGSAEGAGVIKQYFYLYQFTFNCYTNIPQKTEFWETELVLGLCAEAWVHFCIELSCKTVWSVDIFIYLLMYWYTNSMALLVERFWSCCLTNHDKCLLKSMQESVFRHHRAVWSKQICDHMHGPQGIFQF